MFSGRMIFLMFDIVFLLFFFCVSCSSGGVVGDDAEEINDADCNNQDSEIQINESDNSGTDEDVYSHQGFIQCEGTGLVKDGKQIILRGISLGNYVWQDVALPLNHHDETEYAAIEEMGLNLVRFYLHYLTFEDDGSPYVYKESGWEWLDRNVDWADKHGIYLILNIHVPQGGFQSMGEGYDLWEKEELQNRFVAMWKAVAERYRDEPVIAAYDILNEPTVPSGMDVGAWKSLALRTLEAIREVDENHIVVIEPLNGIGGVDGTALSPADRQFETDDRQVMYDFHFYAPSDYTFQGITALGIGEGGKYPDDSRAILPGDAEMSAFHYSNPSIGKDDTDWTVYEGIPWTAADEKLGAASPVLFCNDLTGKVKFDDISVREYDTDGNFIRELVSNGLDSDYGWYSYSSIGTGDFHYDSTDGNESPGSLVIENPGEGSTSVWAPAFIAFPLVKGNSYVVSGAMKGDGVNENTLCEVTLGAYSSESGSLFHLRDREYLKWELEQWSAFADKQDAPLFFGEFGLSRYCFEDSKGGAEWISDVLELLDERDVDAASLHQYYGSYFGLYTDRSEPETANEQMINILINYF